jgi:putative ABC transport system substrate-binding protein
MEAGPTALRRALMGILALVVLPVPMTGEAQSSRKASVGFLSADSRPAMAARTEAFRQGLRDLGHVEGDTISVEYQFADGNVDRLPVLAAELVRLRVNVIVTEGTTATRFAKEATSTIPIVMAQDPDPVGTGFVASLARPGGNITGLSNMAEGVAHKWVELLKEVAPRATRLGVLWDPRIVVHTKMWSEVQDAGRALKVTPLAWEARGADDIERAFAAMAAEKVGGVIALPYPVAGQHRRLIVDLAMKHRLPSVYPFREFAEAGCLMTYGPSNADLYRRAADYVDRILKGARPADLPVEQPTKFELIINRKTAKALAVTIPPSLLARADEIID